MIHQWAGKLEFQPEQLEEKGKVRILKSMKFIAQMNCICIDYSKFAIIYSLRPQIDMWRLNLTLHLRIDLMINRAHEKANDMGKQI